jgi:hypothetical protein
MEILDMRQDMRQKGQKGAVAPQSLQKAQDNPNEWN